MLDLSPMGFRKTPFTRELSIPKRFALPHQQEVVDDLLDAISQRMSAAVIAPAGTGKTVALRALVAALPEARYDVRYIKITGLSKRDLCREISVACGLASSGTYPALVRRLQDRLQQATAQDGVRVVVILDEAHDLRPESLGVLRLLTNFEMDSRLVLSVVLAGQPPLRKMLARPEQDAVAQRLAHVATLRLLSRDESTAYVAHRCAIAGATQPPFDADATETLFEMSSGNLRAIDRLALKSIQHAARRGIATVSVSDVAAARNKLLT